jgi:3-dehydroquinate dehydratase
MRPSPTPADEADGGAGQLGPPRAGPSDCSPIPSGRDNRGMGQPERVLVLNGPNLSRLGSREPDVYGTASFDDLVSLCTKTGGELGFEVDVRQTDDEARERFRHTSVIAAVATGTIAGFGLDSYALALRALAARA